MTATFINRSDKPVNLIFANRINRVAPNQGETFEIDGGSFKFSAYYDIPSSIKNLLFFKSMVLKYNFSLTSEYEVSGFEASENVVIDLFQKISSGTQTDYYSYAHPESRQASITNLRRLVYDEPRFIEKVKQSKKREKIGIVIMSLINALDTFLYVGIPLLILFFGVKNAVDTRTAIIITAFLTAVAFAVGLTLKLLMNLGIAKFNKKHNIDDTPKPKYKGYQFYFDNEYISEVISNEKGK